MNQEREAVARIVDASLRIAAELERQAQQQRETASRLMLAAAPLPPAPDREGV